MLISCAQRNWDMIRYGLAQRDLPTSSETGEEESVAAHGSLSPISPTSTLYDTEARNLSLRRFLYLSYQGLRHRGA